MTFPNASSRQRESAATLSSMAFGVLIADASAQTE
jgi:hypothetical protein